MSEIGLTGNHYTSSGPASSSQSTSPDPKVKAEQPVGEAQNSTETQNRNPNPAPASDKALLEPRLNSNKALSALAEKKPITGKEKSEAEKPTPTGNHQKNKDEQDPAQALKALEESVTEINNYVQSIQRELHFSIDEESGDTVVKVVEKATNEVVRQIPAEDLMESLKNMNKNSGTGVIIRNQA